MKNIRTRTKKPNNDFALIRQDVDTVNYENVSMNFAKIVQGMKFADDAVLDLGRYRKANSNLTDREKLLQALKNKNYDYLRDVSGYFFNNSGIYARICRYLAFLLTYDWMVTPYVVSDSIKEEKVLTEFNKVLFYLDNMNTKSTFSSVSLEVVKNGAYYGIMREDAAYTAATLQQLPTSYCRSRYKINGRDAVEFNVKYFDEQFTDINEKLMVIKSFPKEFAKSYMAYKSGNIQLDRNDNGAWFLCDPLISVRFTLNGNECPIFIASIPAILDLDEAKEVDKKKMLQELLKIVIQKMPLDKNGELVFDVEEARELHNNAVQMLSKAVGVDVLTTFAETEVESLSDRSTNTVSTDALSKVERGVFNEAGLSQMLFATDGNLALEKSVANDEAIMFNLLHQYEDFLNLRVNTLFNKGSKKLYFKVFMPELTIYNFKDMSKLYKDQATLGFSKMLPAIALGQSQSSILATAHFENTFLNLSELMVPLQSSNTQSGNTSKVSSDKTASSNSDNSTGGRPEKPDDQKSEKTIQNRQSKN